MDLDKPIWEARNFRDCRVRAFSHMFYIDAYVGIWEDGQTEDYNVWLKQTSNSNVTVSDVQFSNFQVIW